jgi:archaellum component FlaC
VSFKEDTKQFKDLMTAIGEQRQVLQNVVAGGTVSSAKQKAALDALDEAMDELRNLMGKTKIPDQERNRRVAELRAEIDQIELLKDFESNFDQRMSLVRKLSRLNATLGTWQSMNVFRFDTLLDSQGQDFKTLLEEADKDIKSRQNLQRVLKGIEVALGVGAFGAALAAKLAAAAA